MPTRMYVCAPVTVCLCVCRPLYLPLVATLVLDFVTLSTSVVAGTPVHVVRVVLDGLHLLLTPSRTNSATSSHSVCVLDVEWLEVMLRHCNNALLNQDFPNVCYYIDHHGMLSASLCAFSSSPRCLMLLWNVLVMLCTSECVWIHALPSVTSLSTCHLNATFLHQPLRPQLTHKTTLPCPQFCPLHLQPLQLLVL